MKIIFILLLILLTSIEASKTKQLFEMLQKEASPLPSTEFIQKNEKEIKVINKDSVFDNLNSVNKQNNIQNNNKSPDDGNISLLEIKIKKLEEDNLRLRSEVKRLSDKKENTIKIKNKQAEVVSFIQQVETKVNKINQSINIEKTDLDKSKSETDKLANKVTMTNQNFNQIANRISSLEEKIQFVIKKINNFNQSSVTISLLRSNNITSKFVKSNKVSVNDLQINNIRINKDAIFFSQNTIINVNKYQSFSILELFNSVSYLTKINQKCNNNLHDCIFYKNNKQIELLSQLENISRKKHK